MDRVSLILVIIGALNWLLVGLFQFDFVSWVFVGQTAVLSRIVYSLVGIAGLWSISLLFRDREPVKDAECRAQCDNLSTFRRKWAVESSQAALFALY